MPQVQVTDWRDDWRDYYDRTRRKKRHPKAKIRTENGLKLVLPFAPTGGSHDGFVGEFATLSRPGRKPLTVRTGDGLRSTGFTVFLGYANHQRSVEPLLKILERIADSGERVTLSLSRLEDGIAWNLTSLSVDVLLRQHGTNNVTRCTVALGFTEDVNARLNVGPLSGGKKGGKGKGGKGKDGKGNGGGRGDVVHNAIVKGPGSKAKRTTQRHTVAAGETLASIALLYYGDPNDWRAIGDASGIRDPRKLKVGTRLTIPPAT